MARMHMYRFVLGTLLASWLCFWSMETKCLKKKKVRKKYERSQKWLSVSWSSILWILGGTGFCRMFLLRSKIIRLSMAMWNMCIFSEIDFGPWYRNETDKSTRVVFVLGPKSISYIWFVKIFKQNWEDCQLYLLGWLFNTCIFILLLWNKTVIIFTFHPI
jgi:hypothetical protein